MRKANAVSVSHAPLLAFVLSEVPEKSLPALRRDVVSFASLAPEDVSARLLGRSAGRHRC